jgi:hypothetical protein
MPTAGGQTPAPAGLALQPPLAESNIRGCLPFGAARPGDYKVGQREKRMKSYLAPVFVGAALVAMTGAVSAHHSFAMFDQEHPMEVNGVVKEFKYTSPHSFIILEIKDKDGNVEAWNLEGGSPSALARDGWTSKSLKPGDELHLTIDPLRSGAPGGSWNVNKIKFKNGDPIAATH